MSNEAIRVLLVDDDEDYCLVVQAALMRAGTSAGFLVDTADSLVSAIESLGRRDYDLVLLDLGLSDSYGMGTFERIRTHCSSTPIVILTGADDREMGVEAIRKGASDYLIKGVDSFGAILARTMLYTLERRRAELALRQSERNFRNVINASTDCIVVTDKQGTILFANPAARNLLGYGSTDELLGKPLGFSTLPGERREVEIERGRRKPVVADMTTVKISWQTKDAYLVSLRDNTEFRATKRKLEKYRANLKSLVEERTDEIDTEKELLSVTFASMGEGVVVVDPDKRIMLFNTVAEIMAGWEFEPVQDRCIDELFHIVDERTGQPLESPIDKVLRSGKTEAGAGFEVLLGIDGSEHPIWMVAAPINGNDGGIAGIVLLFRDVAREREIERMKQDFLASVSHELRTPLTSIKAYTETILHDLNMADQTRLQFLNIIDEESDRLAELIEELLEMSRLESGVGGMAFEPLRIPALVEQVITALKATARSKSVELYSEIEPDLPVLQADAGKIESVVRNLVNNAIKFTPEEGSVHVIAREQADHVVISVVDTGLGIPKAALARIFDRFYRAEHPGRHIKGTGLGLAIVKKIVDMHGGTVEVMSTVAQGSTFTVHLPLNRRSPSDAPEPAASTAYTGPS